MGRLKRHLLEQESDETPAAPPQPPPMRLGDLAQVDGLVFCWCNRCSHHATLAAHMLAGRLGPHIAVPDVSAHMNCRGCGSRDVATRPHWGDAGTLQRVGDFNKNADKI